jgi:hypothetical protein
MALQIKRRLGGSAGAPSAGAVVAGQLAFNDNGNTLFIGGDDEPAEVITLVSATRQVEIAAVQTITGAKTIHVDDLHVTGGDDGDVLATDGNGGMAWVSQPPASIMLEPDTALSGNGLVSDPLNLTVASEAQIMEGEDDVNPVTSAGLRQLTGADIATLTTSTPESGIVPAINELHTLIQALEGPLRLVGTVTTANALSPMADGPAVGMTALPAASAAQGWVAIISNSGTGTAPLPAVAMDPGDWVLSNGSVWVHLDLANPATAATNVSVTTISGMSATHVQGALAELFARPTTVAVDGTTIDGNGTSGSPLEVIGYDDGTF